MRVLRAVTMKALKLSIVGSARLLSARRASRRVDFPSAAAATADLGAAVLGAGGNVGDVVTTVSRKGPNAVRPTFVAVCARSRSGVVLADALSFASDELGSAFHPFIGALLLADSGGASIGSVLQHLRDDARRNREFEAARQARALAARLVVPLVVCSLPAVIVGVIVPMVIVSFGSIDL